MSIIKKDTGFIGYNNQASQIQIKDGSNYSAIYPTELGTGVNYNNNTLRNKGLHIELESNNVQNAINEIEDRISQGGRNFTKSSFNVPNGYKIKSVAYNNSTYYMLLNNNVNNTLIYTSNNGISWVQSVSTNSYLISDITVYLGILYGVGYKITNSTYTPVTVQISGTTFTEDDIYDTGFTLSQINTDAKIQSDSSTLSAMCLIPGQSIVVLFMSRPGMTWNDYYTTSSKQLDKIINCGHGFYVTVLNNELYKINNDSLSSINISMNSISHFDPINKCLYGVYNTNLYKINISNTIVESSMVDTLNANSVKNFDIFYINGRYVYNTYNASTNIIACAYGIKPYDNENLTDGKYILNQQLLNLTYQGEYVFGIGSTDGKLYYSLVK